MGGPARLSTATVLPIYWWAWSLNTTNITVPLGWEPMTKLQLGGHCIANDLTWRQGLWPTLGSADGSGPINGGIPPKANLSAHLAAVREQLSACIPDPEFNGLGVLDLEQWDPAWEMNNCTFAGHNVYPADCPGDGWRGAYQEATRSFIRETHPSWAHNTSRVEAESKAAWETSATQFFVQTLDLLHELRPKMKWGVYQVPYKLHGPCARENGTYRCGFDHPEWGPKVRGLYEREPITSVFVASRVLAPSIYVSANVSADIQEAYVRSNVEEARRLASIGRQLSESRAPVVAFGELYYHGQFGPTRNFDPRPHSASQNPEDPPICNVSPRPPNNATVATLIDAADARIQVSSSTLSGADALALWSGGSLPYMRIPYCRQLLLRWLNTTLAPTTNHVRDAADTCAHKLCLDQGVCRVDVTTNSTSCECFSGFTGKDCAGAPALQNRLL